jgi:hypothetical protein
MNKFFFYSKCIYKMFRKAISSPGVSNMFRKGLSTVSSASKGLGGVSSGLNRGITTASKIVNDPLVRSLASATPQGQQALKVAEKTLGGAQIASKGLEQASTLINPKTYTGKNVGENVNIGLQRAKQLDKTVGNLISYVK